jgi:AcrR family transcriptional regulator
MVDTLRPLMQQEFYLSTEGPVPGTLRPRGRTERVRQAVITATRAVLTEVGYDGLSIERVADKAGVAKSTVYRRWRDTTGLLMELLNEFAAVEIPLADTGTVDDDLRRLATQISRFFTDHVAGSLVLALIAESVHNTSAADGLREFWSRRNTQAAEIVHRAIARGELPAATDPVEVIRTLGAPMYYRLLVTHEPFDDTIAERAAATALAAARAGVLNRHPPHTP